MEAALGASFSDVRVHVGPEASAIGAIAFTWGSDLHFAPGQYNPHTPHGQFLLGHAGQLLDAAIRTARRHGLPVAQLEARPDSPTDITPGALMIMYQGYGFRMSCLSRRGSPLMQRGS